MLVRDNLSLIYVYHFSIIAKMEELEEDSVYFILKSGLSSRISLDRAQNVHHGHDNDKRSVMFNYKSFIHFQDYLLIFSINIDSRPH